MPVITIGREFGAGGETVGRLVAERLKLEYLDSKIVDEVAREATLGAWAKAAVQQGRKDLPIINASTLEAGSLKGADHGARISLILDHSEPGRGPRLHRHPYDETWVVIEGRLTFQLGEERLRAGPGDIVIAPPGVPHKFTNEGPGPLSLVCIHANPTFVTEWLE